MPDLALCAQHEVGVRNLEILNSTTDAKGRKLEVIKLHCPPPLFRTYKEAEGVHVRTSPALPVSAGNSLQRASAVGVYTSAHQSGATVLLVTMRHRALLGLNMQPLLLVRSHVS